MTEAHRTVPVAIVGVSALFPGSVSSGGFWRDILAGTDMVTDIPPTHWLIDDYYDPDPSALDKTYARRGAFLKDVPFDPMAWGVPPSIVPATDTTQLLALIVARQVLDDASRNQFDSLDKERISIILGVTGAQELLGTMVNRLQKPVWVKSLREIGLPEEEVQAAAAKIASHYVPWQESSFPGLLGNVVAGRIANRLNLGGTNCVTDAACASSFSALSMGINELSLGQSDLVIAGGADTMNDIFMYLCFSKTPALSKSGDCRPFSDKADGTLLGEGMAMFALKRLDDAERDNDRVYAVIRGVGTSSDGRAKSVYAPVPEGQAKALRRTYATAGYSPETVELVEAHGTGTVAGDAAEFQGLRTVFDESGRTDRQWCAIGTVKSQIGHTKAAAGAAGLFKAVLALHHKILPPTIKVDRPNPKLDIASSPFYLNTETRPWIRGTDHPRRASVSSFGFGGSNFHVAVEEYVGPADHPPKIRGLPGELFVLSGGSGAEVAAAARKLAGEAKDDRWVFLARRTQKSFDPRQPARLAVVASSDAELKTRLDQAASSIATKPDAALDAPFVHYATGGAGGPVAFLFPGQGSQYTGMGADLAMAFDVSRIAWDTAADRVFDGLRLHDVVFPRPRFSDEDRKRDEDRLRDTRWAQPAIGVASLATLAALTQLGVTADAYAGHSFGEVTALSAAGAFGPQALLAIARERGERMAAASHTPGAMCAVPRSVDEVQTALGGLPDGVVVANHNAPKQVVLSGPTSAIEAVEKELLAKGIEAKRLPVATAFHSAVVADAVGPFGTFLGGVELQGPASRVWSNADVTPYGTDPDEVRSRLAAQIAKPVRFVEQIEAMYAAGFQTFVEVGPGTVLTNLVGEILAGKPHRAIATDRKGKRGWPVFLEALGRLVVAGVPVDLGAAWAGYEEPVDPAAGVRPKAALDINGANYGKPYPPVGGTAALPKPNPPRKVAAPVVLPAPQAVAPAPAPNPPPVHAPATAPPRAPLPAPPAPTYAAPVQSDAWLETQRATADAHAAFQRAMTETHLAFLQAVEASFSGAPAHAAPPAFALPVAVMPPFPSGALSRETSVPTWNPPTRTEATGARPIQTGADLLRPAPVSAALLAPPARPATSAPAADVGQALLAVVADKTGYPSEMLGMHLELESDLGVDSIKRVEILSALRERIPGLPEIDPAAMGALRTLGEIAEKLRATLGVSTPAVAPSPSAPAPRAAPASPAGPDLEPTMMTVVAEKTGYPVEMLALHMELESDLGIDSIKRVEILSAVRERVPGLPEVDAAALGQLRTLGQIVEHLRQTLPAGAARAVAAQPVNPAPSAAGIEPTMMAVVAEKTGYPVEMLALHMELESDLGIDSIKRVEILSAVRERVPGLPEVDAAALGQLRTLGQIVDHLRSALPAAPPPPAPAAGGPGLEATMMAVVAEKTGYPVEMLAKHMELEADLGIDSIKRVEILSAVRERVPGLPEVDAAALGQLRTLGQIVDHLHLSLPGSPPLPASAAPRPLDIAATMMAVVAEKTGYPVEMLGHHMELEADLGIDSIKRVEILSAVRERIPGLPEVDASALGALRTLGQIVEALQGAPAASAVVVVPQVSATPTPGLGRWVLEVVPAPAHGVSLPGLDAGPIVVLGGGPVGAALVAQLVARGLHAAAADEPGADAAAVLCLVGLGDGDPDAAGEAAFRAARAIAPRFTERGGLFVTVQDTGGDFGLSGSRRGFWGSFTGLVKTAAQEWPLASLKAIDLEQSGGPDACAARILDELLAGGPEIEVGLRADGSRVTLRSVAAATQPGALPFGHGDVVLATGGARGVTAACLIALAAESKARFALLGRTALDADPPAAQGVSDEAALKGALMREAAASGEKPSPAAIGQQVGRILANREIRATLAAIGAAGGEAKYFAADVADTVALERALTDIRASWGPIRAVVHGAGVLADKWIADKTPEQFRKVYDTKVAGLRALLAATANDGVACWAMFSSVAGRCGNRGQSDYAMANEVLNKVAGGLAAGGGRVKSLGWGPWRGGMVNSALEARFASLGVPMLPLDVGARMFVDELRDTSGAVEIVLGGEPKAEALASDGGQRRVELAVAVHRRSHPYLADHAIAGVPVVPVALALEWMAQAAKAARPDLTLDAVTDLKVLRGIKLEAFDGAGDWFHLVAREVTNGRGAELALEILGAKGAKHYAATARMRDRRDHAPSAARSPSLKLDAWKGSIYDGHLLFHGPGFQMIDEVSGVSKDGIAATLRGTAALGWGGADWQVDPVALDAGLQLALLWTRHVLGGASLPMGLGGWYSYGTPAPGPLRALLRGSSIGRDKTVSDVVFVDSGGAVVAELRGVVAVLRPGESPAQA